MYKLEIIVLKSVILNRKIKIGYKKKLIIETV